MFENASTMPDLDLLQEIYNKINTDERKDIKIAEDGGFYIIKLTTTEIQEIRSKLFGSQEELDEKKDQEGIHLQHL